jgi:hypothetical protein
MTLTRAKVRTSLVSVEQRQRRYRATLHASYCAGTITPETRVRARRTFALLRIKRIRLAQWLTSHPQQQA